jgi:hypothetical protein
LPPDKKRDKTIKDVPVTRLLDDFSDPKPPTDGQSHTDMTDEEYVEMMVRKEIERKLMRKHRDGPLEIPTVEKVEIEMDEEPPPEIPEGSCPSCHYCTIIKKIGNAVYCICANTEREVEGMYFDHRIWIRSEPELTCHKEPPSIRFKKQLRQHMEEKQRKKVESVVNDPDFSPISEKNELQDQEPEIMNFFGLELVRVEQDLVRVDEEVENEDPDIPEVFIRPPDPRKRLVENELVDDFLNRESTALYKHKALETLKKYRKDRHFEVSGVQSVEEGPILSEKMALIQNCESCYFCVDNKRVGGSSWCHCTNIVRSAETVTAASWVRSRLNAPCWRKEESLI